MAGANRGTGKRTGRSGAKRKKTGSGAKIPGWLWLSAGVAIGVFVAILLRLAPNVGVTPPAPKPAAASAQSSKEEAPAGPVFDFYTLLPESEVMVPSSRSDQQSEKQPSAATKSASAKKSEAGQTKAKPAQKSGTQSGDQGGFLLQAGSFRNNQDADRLRAQLILSGFEARIETVTVRGGEKWHRVQLGPYSLEESGEVRSQLSSLGLETMLLRQR